MSGRAVCLVDNVLNPRIYSGHTLAASSTAAGTNVLNLSSGRRLIGVDVNGWFASALNADGYVTATFNRPRAFDLAFVDRGHNLAGQTIRIRVSDDGFTTFEEIGPLIVPAMPTPFSGLYDGQIVRTDEGALLWWLNLHVGHEVRFYVDAMGAGARPELSGLMIGKAFVPTRAEIKPYEPGSYTLMREVSRSPQAQAVGSEIGRFRSGEVRLRMDSWDESATARFPLEDLYLGGHGMVLLHDDQQAERAMFVMHPGGSTGFRVPTGQYLPEIALPYEESEPVLL